MDLETKTQPLKMSTPPSTASGPKLSSPQMGDLPTASTPTKPEDCQPPNAQIAFRTPDVLLCFHLVTCGKQGDLLGQDEIPVVQITFAVLDVSSNRVTDVKKYDVRPVSPFYENVTETGLVPISEEASELTNLTNEYLETLRFPLKQIFDQIDTYLRQRGLHPDCNGTRITLVVDGPLPLRAVLPPEAQACEFSLKPYYGSYYDVRKMAAQACSGSGEPQIGRTLEEAMKQTNVTSVNTGDIAVRHCQNIAAIMKSLINGGLTWEQPERIHYDYLPAVFKRTDSIDEKVAVKARGLPWSATIADLRNFFRGLNIAPGGVALVLSKNGRRNGEALIRFVDQDQCRMAEMRHRHHLGRRYVEVHSIPSEEFMHTAGSESEEGERFLTQITDSYQTVVRMRGLPYNATCENIATFFATVSCQIQFNDDGILFVNHPDGRSTGDAFVIFETEDVADRALGNHKQHIGDRYVELFKSTPAEVNQVLYAVKHNEVEKKTSSNPPSQTSSLPQNPLSRSSLGFPLGLAGLPLLGNNAALSSNPLAAAMNPLAALRASGQFPFLPTPSPTLPASSPSFLPPGTTMKASLMIKGARPETTVADIRLFLGAHQASVIPNGVQFVYNSASQWTGLAVVAMFNESSAFIAAQQRNGQVLLSSSTGKSAKVEVTYIGDMAALVAGSTALQPKTSMASAPTPGSLPYPGMPAATPNQLFYPTMAPYLSMNPGLLNPSGLPSPYMPNYTSPTGRMNPSPLGPGLSTNQLLQAYQQLTNGGSTPVQTQLPPPPPPPTQVQTSQPTAQPANYYMQPSVQPNLMNMVIAKGLPKDAFYNEIVGLFSKVLTTGNIPDIQVSLLQDGTPSGDAYISFQSRTEAELAVTHCNRSNLRENIVELHLIQPGLLAGVQ